MITALKPAHCLVIFVRGLFLHVSFIFLVSVGFAGATTWIGADPQLSHQIGYASGSGSWAVVYTAGPGFMTYGPYSAAFQNGAYAASFLLRVDNNSADNLTIGYVDVYDAAANKVLAHRDFRRREFHAANIYQTFDVSFITKGVNRLEFRVYYYGYSFLELQNVSVGPQSGIGAGAVFYANGTESLHQIGVAAGTMSWATPATSSPAFLTFGPYTQNFQDGAYKATFYLAVDNVSADDQVICHLDVYDGVRVLARRDVHRKEFAAPLAYHAFDLTFTTQGPNTLEFRVYYDGYSYLEHQGTTVMRQGAIDGVSIFYGNETTSYHQLGSAVGSSWAATSLEGEGFLTYGPYTQGIPQGVSTATFSLEVDNNSADNLTVAELEAYDTTHNQILARRVLMRQDFAGVFTQQDFDIVFELNSPTVMEFRVYVFGVSYVQHLLTVIRPDRLNLTSLWNGESHFEYRKRDPFFSGSLQDWDTSSLVTLDGTWYAFNRQNRLDEASKLCPDGRNRFLNMVVRASSDQGVTWSDPVDVAEPTGDVGASKGASDACDVVDGGAFFDTENDTWHLLSQCDGTKPGWNLCHYTRLGRSPMGSFTPDPKNPVVTGGQLWSRICAGSGKSCPVTMVDEGTPQIIKKSDGFYYVTFHGANNPSSGNIVTGARGVARTPDFLYWEVAGDNLPGNAILSSVDCNGWNAGWGTTGCIGEGAARILRSDGYNYILTEAADQSLLCSAGQTWVFGLLRNPILGPSGTWENYPANPFVVDLNTASQPPCPLQYPNLFRDRGEIFLNFALYTPDYSLPNYTYQLVNGAGPSSVLWVK